MHRKPLRIGAATSIVAGIVLVTGAPDVIADDATPSGSSSPTPSTSPSIDASDPDLKLPEGATLAPPKVLDIKSIVEDENGDERREEDNEEVGYTLQAEVLFPMDSSKLSDKAVSRIQKVADDIKRWNVTGTIKVHGFTDNLGSYAHGLALSTARAQAVAKILRQELGSAAKFEVKGYSEDYPIADNSTEDGRKKNRRVMIIFPKGS